MRIQILKVVAFVFAALVLMHWLTAGNDETLEGPIDVPSHHTKS